ncbi:dethiobiotin synthase [Enemella sp. A6]|uniref:dethiobiotin synthase n=1 Tax=Enemella sp. A6 TaxID=3440152 RepID=UPI003EBF063D
MAESLSVPPGITIVTGTDTDVGKTVATAALTRALLQRGRTVLVCKPAQTGVSADEPGDLAEVCRLSGLLPEHTVEGIRVPEPLAPTTAGRRAGVALPSVAEHADRLRRLADDYEHVLVEGAGGVLVGLDDAGATVLDLADELVELGMPPGFVVVARAGLGTLNHTGLTCAAIRARQHTVTGLIIGSMPDHPDLAEQCNLTDLPAAAGCDLLAALPAGLGSRPGPLDKEHLT